jgi:UTP--glucose-1-phosphate uridylyltransferase
MHVLTPLVMELLAERLAQIPEGPVPLSPALAELARRAQYLAVEEADRRYDIGARYGLLVAQLALGLSGGDRTEVLAQIVELLAAREMAAEAGSKR